jgi:hypothetical protein
MHKMVRFGFIRPSEGHLRTPCRDRLTHQEKLICFEYQSEEHPNREMAACKVTLLPMDNLGD